MSKPNYKLRLKNALDRISKNIVLISSTKPLDKKADNGTIGVNKVVMTVYRKALNYIDNGDTDKAYTLLTHIPYSLSGPSLRQTDYDYVGTNKAYREFDNVRHCIRMLDLESGSAIGSSSKWNNVIVF